MRTRYLGALATLVAGAGLTFGQDAAPEKLPAPADPGKPVVSKPVVSKADCDKGSCDKGSCSSCQAGQASTDCGDGVIIGTPLWAGDCKDCKPCKEETCNAWFGAEYLLWWLKDAPGAGAGFGGPNGFDYGTTSGVRVSAGLTGDDHFGGLEGTFFMLERRSASSSAVAPAGGVTTPLGVIPGGAAGSLTEWNRFWGGDALVTKAAFGAVAKDSSWEVDFLGGFEYLDLGERLKALAVAPGFDGIATHATRDQFYGLELGARAEFALGRFFVNATGLCGLGEVHQGLQFDVAAAAGGVTAAASAHPVGDDFAVVPHVILDAGFNVTKKVRIFAGYDFLYWNNVVRPGDQVSTTLPTSLQRSDFWAHGVNIGAAIRY
jgi:Putative beta barrel porin-7 (BBP7)